MSCLFADHLNLSPVLTSPRTWVCFSNGISQGCLPNCVSAVCLKWKFPRLERYSDRGAAFWYLDNQKCFNGWCRNVNDAEQSHFKYFSWSHMSAWNFTCIWNKQFIASAMQSPFRKKTVQVVGKMWQQKCEIVTGSGNRPWFLEEIKMMMEITTRTGV